MVALETYIGSEISSAIVELARLRIQVFREFPYLYDGDEDYERHYLEIYARHPQAAVILARDGGNVVGASTCLPLQAETDAVRAPFESRKLDVQEFFYFGESVLQPAYRGQGIGVKFFEAREKVAHEANAAFAIFCAVRRPEDHWAKPANHLDMPRFWRQRGYTPLPGISCQMAWKEIGGLAQQDHDLDFWIKLLGSTALPAQLA